MFMFGLFVVMSVIILGMGMFCYISIIIDILKSELL